MDTIVGLGLDAAAGGVFGIIGTVIGRVAGFDAEAKIGKASLWVINLLRLVRPVLTLMLWLITGWIFSVTQNGSIVEAAVFAATAATLWWFGDRAPKPSTRLGGSV